MSKKKISDKFELVFPGLRKEEVPIVKEAIIRFTKNLLNELKQRRISGS